MRRTTTRRTTSKKTTRSVRVVRVKNSAGGTYEAASTSRRAGGWNAPTSSPNRAILDTLSLLRDRSRLAVRNDGYAGGAIDKLVSNIVGTGIAPLSEAEDKTFRKAAQELFLRWTDESDADGLLDWYGQQAQAVRCWLEAGEVFVRFRDRLASDGLSVPLQVQVIEPELCPHNWNSLLPGAPAGNRVRAGIEFDKIGRRVAYYFYAQRPGDMIEVDSSQIRRVPAANVLHVYKPLRAGQLRGVPHLVRALIKLRELDKFDDATLLRQQLANLFVAFLTHPTGDNPALLPMTNLAADGTEADRPTLALQPGIFQELGPGEKVEWSTPPDANQGYVDFVKQQLRSIGSAVGVPYEVLTGDLSGVNDRVVRVILAEFRRAVMADQHQTVVHMLCRPTWSRWMFAAYASGALAIPAEYLADPWPFERATWVPQAWPYLHPVQDVQAAEKAIRAGFTSRSAVVAEQGADPEAVDEQQARDNERADELELKYDSDGRNASGAGASAFGETPVEEEKKDEAEDEERPKTKAGSEQTVTLTLKSEAPEVHVEAPVVQVAPTPVQVNVAAPVVHVAAPESPEPEKRSRRVEFYKDSAGRLAGFTEKEE